MAQKVLYFTVGDKPTGPEQTAIDALLAGRYDVGLRNASESAQYGAAIEPCDFRAGSSPPAYAAIPVWTGIELPDGTAAVANSSTVAVRNSAGADSHNATAVVAGNTLTGVNLAATMAMVDNADNVVVRNSASGDLHTAVASVAAGAITGVNLAATVAMVDNNDAPAMQNSAGTVKGAAGLTVVAAGVLTAVRTPATSAIVVNNEALVVPVTGTYTTTATVAIAGGVVTGITLS